MLGDACDAMGLRDELRKSAVQRVGTAASGEQGCAAGPGAPSRAHAAAGKLCRRGLVAPDMTRAAITVPHAAELALGGVRSTRVGDRGRVSRAAHSEG